MRQLSTVVRGRAATVSRVTFFEWCAGCVTQPILRRWEARLVLASPPNNKGQPTSDNTATSMGRIRQQRKRDPLLGVGEIPAREHTPLLAKKRPGGSEKFKEINLISTPPQFPLRLARIASLTDASRHPAERKAARAGNMCDFCVPWFSWKRFAHYMCLTPTRAWSANSPTRMTIAASDGGVVDWQTSTASTHVSSSTCGTALAGTQRCSASSRR